MAQQHAKRPTFVNKSDDVDAAVRYMAQGCCVAPRGRAKRLLHTARDLVEGRVTPEQVTSTLVSNSKSTVLICTCTQASAWKSGHKQKCNGLGMLHKRHQEAFEVVDNVHSTSDGSMYCGIPLCLERDCHLVGFVSTCPLSPGSAWRAFSEPSMSTFYKNLGRAARGEWWIWKSVNNKHLYQSVVAGSGKETEYFKLILWFLCFDFFERANTSSATAADHATESNHQNTITASDCAPKSNQDAADRATALREYEGFRRYLVEEHGAAMPAKVLVALYKGCPRITNPVDKQRVRTRTDDECRDCFQRSYQK